MSTPGLLCDIDAALPKLDDDDDDALDPAEEEKSSVMRHKDLAIMLFLFRR
jgi:hypothetical protein